MQTSLYKISGLHGVVFSGKYDAMQILYGVGLHGVGLHGVGLHVRGYSHVANKEISSKIHVISKES